MEAVVSKIKWNKLFAIFLEKNGAIANFRRTDYGYRTYDGAWKFFRDNLTIIHTTYEEIYNGYDFDKKLAEAKYQVVIRKDLSGVDVKFMNKKLY